MINEKCYLEVIDEDLGLKRKVQISELIELVYQAVNEKLNRKVLEPKEKVKK